MCQMCEEYEAELRRLGIAMDEITVNLDPDTREELEQQAKTHGQSIAHEAEHILREHAAQQKLRRDPVAWSRALRAMSPPGTTDTLTLLREDRDR
jgi:plasmid stability protein